MLAGRGGEPLLVGEHRRIDERPLELLEPGELLVVRREPPELGSPWIGTPGPRERRPGGGQEAGVSAAAFLPFFRLA